MRNEGWQVNSDESKQVEGVRSTSSVRDAVNRLSRSKFMAADIIVKYSDLINMQIGNLLGTMKATLDTLPDSYAVCQKLNNVALNDWIKEQVNEQVFYRLLQKYQSKDKLLGVMRSEKEILKLEIVEGEYDEEYSNKLLVRFFPKGVDKFVTSFAYSYNTTFHMIANEAGVKTVITEPLTQDIWRNWSYFWNPEEKEYRLDGGFVHFYEGDKEIGQALEDGDCFTEINQGVYEALKNVKRT